MWHAEGSRGGYDAVFALGSRGVGASGQESMKTVLKIVLLCLYAYHFGALLTTKHDMLQFRTRLLISVNASAPYDHASRPTSHAEVMIHR